MKRKARQETNWMKCRRIPRAVKHRIRTLIATEMRDRLTELPGAVAELPDDDPIKEAWSIYVLELADQIQTGRL